MGRRIPLPLRKALAIAIVLLALSGTGLGLSIYARHDQTQMLALAQRALTQARSQLQQARDDTVRSQLARSRLAALELIDADTVPGRRHDALRRLQSDPHLFSVELRTRPRVPDKPDTSGLPTRSILHLSLRAGVLHEEALSVALQSLAATPGVSVIPRGCQIIRAHATHDDGPVVTPLHARCELDWITLHPAAGASS
ncbi:MAG: hypothetical protein CVU19_08995 [Betaproteobacteria bacterium HGW-Betaproteobacteria-13]|jgi:hypothetical protein|uniref:Uncharacterized protein n=1 Tax=Parazoarcus communis TaxID=41977 RepID=A0A2U8GWY9_9RHOO|nr:hypothetical protein [Parazoarcus communis]AWI78237.1 hypothetical protein CEW87_02045 [Parazoarcus communis]PKO81086.1 MAG: hypothetical protein CVU19_08995 [Betaproteobacteria bacterium HGW-Betaproteobacteria-13]